MNSVAGAENGAVYGGFELGDRVRVEVWVQPETNSGPDGWQMIDALSYYGTVVNGTPPRDELTSQEMAGGCYVLRDPVEADDNCTKNSPVYPPRYCRSGEWYQTFAGFSGKWLVRRSVEQISEAEDRMAA